MPLTGRSARAAASVFRTRASFVAFACLMFVTIACEKREPPRDPEVPERSIDTAPWLLDQHGTVEESAPGSGVFLLQPGDFRARLPEEFRRSGIAVVFSGRPQPSPAGREIVGQPFVLTAIRRETSAWERLAALLRAQFSPADTAAEPPFGR